MTLLVSERNKEMQTQLLGRKSWTDLSDFAWTGSEFNHSVCLKQCTQLPRKPRNPEIKLYTLRIDTEGKVFIWIWSVAVFLCGLFCVPSPCAGCSQRSTDLTVGCQSSVPGVLLQETVQKANLRLISTRLSSTLGIKLNHLTVLNA